MKFDILTLFPEMFEAVKQSIIGKAIEKQLIQINLINIRNFSKDKHKKVDDTPYGGGQGMVLMCKPLLDCLKTVVTKDSLVILMSPQGMTHHQAYAEELALKQKHIVIICGHYEGFDERIRTLCDLELSIGDFVLTGGEYPSMCMMDAIIRLIPGVINKESLDSESFTNNTLDYPMYTKPYEYEGMKVPDVLISGNHQKIDEWRKEMAMKKTLEKRPDLMEDSNE